MARLQGKRALITGGTSGIGLETARRFLEEGARVAITGHSSTGLDAARKELGDVIVIEADAGDAADQRKVADEIRRSFGQLNVLFINAGIVELRPIGQWDAAAFDQSFNTNVKGPYFLVQELLPLFANPNVDRDQRIGQSAYRDANIEHLCSNEGRDDFVDENAFGRIDFTRYSGERGECRPNYDAASRRKVRRGAGWVH